MTTAENDESRLAAAQVDGKNEDHPDSARQHEPRSRGRNGQHRSVDLSRCIGGGTQAAPRRAGVFEWMRAVRDAPLDVLPRRVKATLFVLATYANPDGGGAFPGMDRLGENVGKAADNVGRDLKLAVDRGYLGRSRSNRQQTYRYRLTIPAADPTETSSRIQPDPTESSDRDPTETSGYLPRRPTQEEATLRVASDKTNGDDDMNYDVPAIEDDALHDALRGLSPAPRELAAAKWTTPGGPEIVRAALDRADRGDSIDEARFENLLADERVAFLVESTDGFVRRAEIHAYWRDAERAADRLRADGVDVVVTAAVGHDAEAHLRGAA